MAKLKEVYVNDLIATSNANGLKVANNAQSQSYQFKSKQNFRLFQLICPEPFAL